MKKRSDEWTRTTLRRSLYDRIAKIYVRFGYGSVPDFVGDAVRRRLEPLEDQVDQEMMKEEKL